MESDKKKRVTELGFKNEKVERDAYRGKESGQWKE